MQFRAPCPAHLFLLRHVIPFVAVQPADEQVFSTETVLSERFTNNNMLTSDTYLSALSECGEHQQKALSWTTLDVRCSDGRLGARVFPINPSQPSGQYQLPRNVARCPQLGHHSTEGEPYGSPSVSRLVVCGIFAVKELE